MPWLKVLIAFCVWTSAASAQEVGELESFGQDGRLYSMGSDEFYLVSRQTYGTEDSVGYQGQIRIVKKYPGGGYEIKMMDYIARCRAVDGDTMIMLKDTGKGEDEFTKNMVSVRPEQAPGAAKKDAYNLFWAACRSQFRKFK